MTIMLRIIVLVCALSVILALGAVAATPVAEVLSAKPFELRGATVPVGGASAWPVLAGDTIATKEAPAKLDFRDGSRITLSAGARVSIENEGAQVHVRVLTGAIRYKLKPGSNVVVSAMKLPVIPQMFSGGTLSVLNNVGYASVADHAYNAAMSNTLPVTPFNLGYLNGLRGYDPATLNPTNSGSSSNGTPPAPPPGNLDTPSPLNAVSQLHP